MKQKGKKKEIKKKEIKKAAKHCSKVDLIFNQKILTPQLTENKQDLKLWASLKMSPLLF